MSTTRKIEVYLSQQALADAGKSKCYFNATPQQNRTVCTLIIGGKGYTEAEVKALVRDLMHGQDSADTANGCPNAVCDWAGILNKHGITL